MDDIVGDADDIVGEEGTDGEDGVVEGSEDGVVEGDGDVGESSDGRLCFGDYGLDWYYVVFCCYKVGLLSFVGCGSASCYGWVVTLTVNLVLTLSGKVRCTGYVVGCWLITL